MPIEVAFLGLLGCAAGFVAVSFYRYRRFLRERERYLRRRLHLDAAARRAVARWQAIVHGAQRGHDEWEDA